MKLIDSTFVIDLLRNRSAAVSKASELDATGEAAASEVTVYEVFHGVFAAGSKNRARRWSEAAQVFDRITVFPLGRQESIRAAEISADLDSRGVAIGVADCLIAGTALAHGATTVITRNERHFNRVPGLKAEVY